MATRLLRHRRLTAFRRFILGESSGGLVLIASAIVAVIWANSPAAPAYQRMLHWPLGVLLGARTFTADLRFAVDDGLMAIFFLLVALEIRREVTEGRLATLKLAAAPLVAAIGGMVVPALIYVAFCHADRSAMRGWAIPVATDIAFSLAVLRLLGSRVPGGLQVFLTALAIIDDLGAIVVIAIFYTAGLSTAALGGAASVWLILFGLNRAGVRLLSPYLVGGFALWALVAASGVHPTIAGVALAFVVPAAPGPHGAASAAAKLEHGLAGIVGYGILPLFGLANAGLRLDALPPHILSDLLVWGIVAGLFIGKQVGVFGTTFLAARAGLIRLPGALSTRQLYGASVLCGIGFTMSLFIGDLAFRGHPRHADVKLAVFAGSLLSAITGVIVLWRARPVSKA